MVAPSTRQQGGNQREGSGQEFGKRTAETSYPGRYTGNTQRRTLPEALEASPVQGPELQEQKEDPYRQDFSAHTRCTSPVPFKTHTTPQLNLQIPKHPRHLATATMMDPARALKRHTSPYPTPASSPNGGILSPSLSPPARSNTHPVGKKLEDLKQKYTDRMKSLLECNLKVFGHSQSQSKESPKEIGLEANPVPYFFVGPIYDEATASFTSTLGDSPDENVMMDTEYITMGSVQDLDNEMRDFLPDTYSEFMPDPEEPIQESKSNVVVTVDSPSEAQQEFSHPVVATNGLLTTPMKGHPISDSGIESMMGSPGRCLSFSGENAGLRSSVQTTVAAKKDFPVHTRKISATPSLETEAGLGNGSLVGRPNLMSDANLSYAAQHGQELTPPSSANLSPRSFHAAQSELSNMMAHQSIQAIETHILGPMSENLDLLEFQEICVVAKEKIYQGRIRCLRDLEKYFINMGNQKTMTPTVSSVAFFDAFLSGIQEAWPSVLESDRVRQGDAPYSEGYFLDTRHQHGIETGKSLQPLKGHQQTSKRRLSTGADTLSPAAKRPMTSATAFNIQQGTFVKPISQPRQNNTPKKHLEIQTQAPFDIYNPPVQLYNHPQQSFVMRNSTFTFDENTKTTIAKGQFHDTQTYHDAASQMWQPAASQFSLPASVVVSQHCGFWPPQPPIPATSSIEFAMLPTTPTSAATTTNPSKLCTPLSQVNSREEAIVHSCEICNKTFPRPCDLTKHRKTHERPFKCDFTSCKYHTEGFPTNKERERHQNDIHASDSKEWKCQFSPCPYKSKRESNCKQHMEKAHQYVYKRMKRNPRRRDQGAPPAQATKRRKNTSTTSQPQATALLRSSPLGPSGDIEMAQAPHQNLLPQAYFPPPLSNTPELLDPGQVEIIGSSVFQGSLSPHTGPPFYEGSPTTNTDFERSPLTIGSNGFGDHHNSGLRINSNNSPMVSGDDWDFTGESGGSFTDQFFPPNGNFCMPQPQQQTPVNFPNGLDFGENIPWNPESDTPD